MASLVQCLIRTCLEYGEGGGDGDGDDGGTSLPPSSRTMARPSSPPSLGRLGLYAPATLDDPSDAATGEDDGGGDDHACDGAAADSVGEEDGGGGGGGGLHGLFLRFGLGGVGAGPYGSLAQSIDSPPSSPILTHGDAAAGATTSASATPSRRAVRRSISNPLSPGRTSPSRPSPSSHESPLRTAASFDYNSSPSAGGVGSTHIPAIQLDEIVLPGSDLQKQMSLLMSRDIETQEEDECVICLENFSPDNPRMPTLCGCGENKTYFHLPCLYQWIEQSRHCPSCRKRLRWEEF